MAQQVVDVVVGHAREAAPAECCGILLGRDSGVVAAFRARNIADTPTSRFLIEPEDHFRARREARRQGLDVVGFYHSHPRTPAVPSTTDLAEGAYPEHLYLIVSLAESTPDVRLFRLGDGVFEAVALCRV